MAKKKEELEKVADDLIAGLDDTLKEIKGLDIADADDNIPCISTGIDLLDEVMGGGVPVGKLCAMTGSAGSGKSTAAVQYIVGFQKANPKSLGIYLDIEQAISMKRLVELGCDPHRTKLISKTVTIVQGVIKYKITNKMTDVPYLVIWDSESVTPTKKSLEVTESSKVMGEHSRTLGFIMNQLIPLIAKSNVTLVVIQQLRDKISQNPYEVRFDLNYGSNQKATGGSVMQYYPFNLCRTRNKGDLDYDMMGIKFQFKLFLIMLQVIQISGLRKI